MSLPITVIGIGEDGLSGLSVAAREALSGATLVCGGERHLAMLDDDAACERLAWGKDMSVDIEAIGERAVAENICVLASGDPLNYGVAIRMIRILGADAVRVLPFPSAFSLAAARMNWPLSDPMLRTLSVHSRPLAALRRDIQPNLKLIILSRDGDSPAEIAEVLASMGYGQSPVTVLERIGGDAEARSEGLACNGFDTDFDNLNTVCVHCVADADVIALSRALGLADDAFDHDGTITKRDVRAVTLAALAPRPGEMLWDIGAGNGTVAIEWLRTEPSAGAVTFEHEPERLKRILANAERLGVPELISVEGHFPDDTPDDLSAPDAIFVGGGIARNSDILVAAYDALKPGGRIVANAVTLEAQAHLLTAARVMGGEMVRIGIAQAAPVGSMTALKPAIDVLQWRKVKS
ncbi:precorrin-6y C5,15-methyltransferase (decarboxylating) subunit CbiE [Thalassospiraceae bacterium LMO-JJ14]|nr:precorrin-6y C5,15-methyltransferase (decarboxylating) subunit CbiE [Thalassospiraceae bacterium LMO-JJ14]